MIPRRRTARATERYVGCQSCRERRARRGSTPRVAPAGRVVCGELVWVYRDHFQVTRGGEIIAEQHDWDALRAINTGAGVVTPASIGGLVPLIEKGIR